MSDASKTWNENFAALTREPSGVPKECLIIGEVAQAHDGSLGIAHSYIDAIADAGANAVKFQTHIAAAESTPAEPWRVVFSKQDKTRYDYWKRMEFTEEQWFGLREHAHDRGLIFLSSPFSLAAVELLERVGVDAWKVASGELSQFPMLERMVRTSLPMILSTGMSGWSEVDSAVNLVRAAGRSFALLQCTTSYPCPDENIGLNVLQEMRAKYRCAVGLSDHSGTIFPSLAAVALGASVLEVHVTFSREMFGPDARASLTPEDLKQLVRGVRSTTRMLCNPVDKNAMAEQMAPLRATFNKSLVAACSLPPGTILQAAHLAAKKPGSGMPVARLPEVIGRRLRRGLQPDEQLKDSDVE